MQQRVVLAKLNTRVRSCSWESTISSFLPCDPFLDVGSVEQLYFPRGGSKTYPRALLATRNTPVSTTQSSSKIFRKSRQKKIVLRAQPAVVSTTPTVDIGDNDADDILQVLPSKMQKITSSTYPRCTTTSSSVYLPCSHTAYTFDVRYPQTGTPLGGEKARGSCLSDTMVGSGIKHIKIIDTIISVVLPHIAPGFIRQDCTARMLSTIYSRIIPTTVIGNVKVNLEEKIAGIRSRFVSMMDNTYIYLMKKCYTWLLSDCREYQMYNATCDLPECCEPSSPCSLHVSEYARLLDIAGVWGAQVALLRADAPDLALFVHPRKMIEDGDIPSPQINRWHAISERVYFSCCELNAIHTAVQFFPVIRRRISGITAFAHACGSGNIRFANSVLKIMAEKFDGNCNHILDFLHYHGALAFLFACKKGDVHMIQWLESLSISMIGDRYYNQYQEKDGGTIDQEAIPDSFRWVDSFILASEHDSVDALRLMCTMYNGGTKIPKRDSSSAVTRKEYLLLSNTISKPENRWRLEARGMLAEVRDSLHIVNVNQVTRL